MLHFCNNNIYYALELSNDIVDEMWTSEFPACVNDFDAEGIYEGVKLHKFDFKKDIASNYEFFKDKKNIAFSIYEMIAFIFSWYDSCAQRRTIPNIVNVPEWISDYLRCYHRMYEDLADYAGALGYYESLAFYAIHQYIYRTKNEVYPHIKDIGKLNPIPEVSWMLEDYLYSGKKSVWANYLTEYVRNNIRSMIYKRSTLNRAYNMFNPSVPLNTDITIHDIDFTNPESIIYFDNPCEADFHTNFMYIRKLIEKYGKVDK